MVSSVDQIRVCDNVLQDIGPLNNENADGINVRVSEVQGALSTRLFVCGNNLQGVDGNGIRVHGANPRTVSLGAGTEFQMFNIQINNNQAINCARVASTTTGERGTHGIRFEFLPDDQVGLDPCNGRELQICNNVVRQCGVNAGTSLAGGQHGISVRIAGTGTDTAGSVSGFQDILISNNIVASCAASGVHINALKDEEVGGMSTLENPTAGKLEALLIANNISRNNGTEDFTDEYGTLEDGMTSNDPADSSVLGNIDSDGSTATLGTMAWTNLNNNQIA